MALELVPKNCPMMAWSPSQELGFPTSCGPLGAMSIAAVLMVPLNVPSLPSPAASHSPGATPDAALPTVTRSGMLSPVRSWSASGPGWAAPKSQVAAGLSLAPGQTAVTVSTLYVLEGVTENAAACGVAVPAATVSEFPPLTE